MLFWVFRRIYVCIRCSFSPYWLILSWVVYKKNTYFRGRSEIKAGGRGGEARGAQGNLGHQGGRPQGTRPKGKPIRGEGEGGGPKGAGRALYHWGTIPLRLQTR